MIGMENFQLEREKIPSGQAQVRPALCMVAHGTTLRSSAGRLIATTTSPPPAATTRASAWSSSHSPKAWPDDSH